MSTIVTNTAATKSWKLKIASYVCLTFFGYISIGLPLGVLPIFLHKTLGFNEVITGIVISLQYVTTFFIRGYAGTIVDKKGPKVAVYISMVSFAVSGLLFALAIWQQHTPMLSLVTLSVSRLIMGCGEGMIGASPVNWAMLVVGRQHTAEAISYNGIFTYGSLAIGAPLGVYITQFLGLQYIGAFSVLFSLLGLLYAKTKPAVKESSVAADISFIQVLKKVAPYGLGLGLAGIGFGSISNFITLYYDYWNWQNAAYALTVFSAAFITGRFIFSNAINKHGGINVAIFCILTEVAGLGILFMAGNAGLALIGAAISGLGFSLVFPALGVEAVKLLPASRAGVALAAYGLFIDLSLGVTGPFSGTIVNLFGMRSLYAFSAGLVFAGLILLLYPKKKNRVEALAE